MTIQAARQKQTIPQAAPCKPFASLTDYYSILSSEYPSFLNRYIALPCMQRLAGVGLLCGTDWTPLYHNAFYYSRLDHSIGVALIVWNFTHDKKQTLAGLFHDLSTPAFSHVNDFRNGDTIRQESTESANGRMIIDDAELAATLAEDGFYGSDVNNYHRFPVCDNEVPLFPQTDSNTCFRQVWRSTAAGTWSHAGEHTKI
jgi:uncharacterized protein